MPGILILRLLWSQRDTQLHARGSSHGGEQRQPPCPAEQGTHGRLPQLLPHCLDTKGGAVPWWGAMQQPPSWCEVSDGGGGSPILA